jgi:small subunit ribosomal protein S1
MDNNGGFILENLSNNHDEGWWASVLKDEETSVSSEPVGNSSLRNGKSTLKSDLETNNWKYIEESLLNDTVIDVLVGNYNRGGLLVTTKGIQGFVPASHLINMPYDCMEEDRVNYYVPYLQEHIKVKIIECDPTKERVVLSERAALAGEGKRKELINSLKEGEVIEGIVTNMTNFGVFLDMGGVEGLIHVSELSWGRVKIPSAICDIGEKIKVQVLKIDERDGKIALSRKRLYPNPWLSFARSYSIGDIIFATITNVLNYGAFAKTEEGIEGLIHASSIIQNTGIKIQDTVKSGDRVQVKIHQIDVEKRRLSLILVEEMQNG